MRRVRKTIAPVVGRLGPARVSDFFNAQRGKGSYADACFFSKETDIQKVIATVALGLTLVPGARCGAQIAGKNPEIDALRAEWVQDLETHQLEPSLALFTDDAAFLNGDGSRLQGKDAIRGLYQQIFAASSGQITLDARQLVVSQVMAYESGT